MQPPRGAWRLARSLRRRPRCVPSSPRAARAPRTARALPSAAFLCRQRKLLQAAARARRGRRRNPTPSRWPLRSPSHQRRFDKMIFSPACAPCKFRSPPSRFSHSTYYPLLQRVVLSVRLILLSELVVVPCPLLLVRHMLALVGATPPGQETPTLLRLSI